MFATNLRWLHHERGISQDAFAYEAEVSRSYLSQLEKGAFHASRKIIGRLAEALGVEPAELLRLPAKHLGLRKQLLALNHSPHPDVASGGARY